MNNNSNNCGDCGTTCSECGRPWAICKQDGGCGCNKCKDIKFCEYGRMANGCIREKQPGCPMQAVIPSVTVESIEGIKNLADCLVHVSDINTTFYIDDKHRPIITWAGPIDIPGYDMEGNPNNYRDQIVTDVANQIAVIYDKSGNGYTFGLAENIDLQEQVNNKLDEMAKDGTLQDIIQEVLGSYDVYNFHTVMATKYYRSNEPEYGMQGGCVLPDGTIFQCTGNNSGTGFTGKLLHFAQDGTLLNSATVDYGHCNGCTYNSKTGKVVITSTQDESIGKYMIYEVDPTNLTETARYDLSTKGFPDEPYGIVYVEEDDTYVFCNYWYLDRDKYLWKTQSDYTLIESKQIDISVRSTSNIGRFGDYLGVNTINANNVMLFNLHTMDFYREVNIDPLVSDSWVITEVEWFDTRNGKIYLGFVPACATSPKSWGFGTKVYAMFDPAINYKEIRKTHTQFAPSDEIYYVDSSLAYNPLRDGSYDAPFSNINEALNSALRTKNVTGQVQIYVISDVTDTLIPFFSMNKRYNVAATYESNPMKFMSAFYVGPATKVIFNRGVTLTATGNDYEDHRVTCHGECLINGLLQMSDSSKTTIKANSMSEIACKMATAGVDLTDFYGKFINNNTERTNNNDIITKNNDPTSNLSWSVIGLYNQLTAIDTNKFQLPNLSKVTYVTIRYKLPNGNGKAKLEYETTITRIYNLYSQQLVKYIDGSNAEQIMKITISNQGVLTISGLGNVSDLENLRVIVYTAE